jgi:hypothetical protein
MAKRPRATCRVCRKPWRGRWNADVVVVVSHPAEDGVCAGSGLPAIESPETPAIDAAGPTGTELR